MKIINLAALLLTVFFLSCGKDFSNDINELRSLYERQSELLNQLKKGVTISSYKEDSDGYTLTFSDGKTVSLKNSQAPVVKIGDNLNWFINGIDTGISSRGKDGANGTDGKDGANGADGKNGVDAQSPKVELINGVWFINGVNTGVKGLAVDGKNGVDGKEAPYIVSSIYNGTAIIFNFSDGSIIESKLITKRFIVSWGDSLTEGYGNEYTYTSRLSQIVGLDNFDFYNFGVSGENTLQIGARQGGIPMYIDADITLPATTSAVVIGNRSVSNIRSTWNDAQLLPFMLNRAANTTINNCTINGVSVILRFTGTTWNDPNGSYTIQRAVRSDKSTVLKAGSLLYTAGMKDYRNAHANIYFMGQNGGYTTNEDLVAQYKSIVSFSNSNNYLILGLTTGTEESRKDLEKMMTKEFGARYVNVRRYLSSDAMSDLGLTPTKEDLEAMAKGAVPKTLLTDAIHYNSLAHKAIGEHIHRKFTYLGVF